MLKDADNDGKIAAEIMGRTVRAAPGEIVQRLTKINAALVERLENRIDQQASAYSLFQTAIGLEAQVRERTAELKRALLELERSNGALVSAKEAAEKANSSKTRFLAAAGHDLLQPLYAAQLSMSTLVDMQADAGAAKLCRQVDRALVTIEAYLRSILDISKLDAGVVTPEFQSVRLSDMFQSLDSDFRPIVERKNLKLRFRPTDAAVVSDPILLRRILQNLVSNATRYTNEGGVFIGARMRGDHVRIEVTDTGVGVEPSEIERIFEEFHRAHAGDAAQAGEGLGLGLSNVRRMSQALDHRVEHGDLVGEMPVDRPARDAGLAGDVVQRGLRDTLPIEYLDRGVEDAVARFLRVFLGSSDHGSSLSRAAGAVQASSRQPPPSALNRSTAALRRFLRLFR